MRQHLLAIIAVLAAAILALFSINTEYSGSRYGYGYGRQNVVGAQFIKSNGTDTPDTEEFVIPVVRANNHSSLQGKTVPIVQDEHPSLVEANFFSPLHHTAMTALSPAEVPPLDAGMVNVTDGTGYRVGTRFIASDGIVSDMGANDYSPLQTGEFQLAIPYDPSLLPQGFTEDDILTYVYDRHYHRWVAIERDSVNEVELLVYSRFSRNPLVGTRSAASVVGANDYSPLQAPEILNAMHLDDGGDSPLDFINAVLKTPEMPETSAYTPTSIKELKAADPLEGLTLMQPPTANNSGTANLSYPIEIPAGRQGMQPNLALTYSSGGGNGWLGVGWDIPIPSITVETRWGVPRYDSDYESEVYVYEGEQLVSFDSLENKFREMPHRTNHWTSRNDLDSVEQFYPRKNETFDSIVRHGNGPGNYWWTVTHKNGVTDYYGKYASDSIVNNRCVLRAGPDNTHGPIAHWALAESVDPFGNSVRYRYTVEYHNGISGSHNVGRQIYIDSILYTSNGNDSGKYKVVFTRQQEREDIIVATNRGFKEVTASTLCNIAVGYDNRYFKYYVFETEYGRHTNFKTRLTGMAVLHKTTDTLLHCVNLRYISQDSFACTHFDYFNYPDATELFGEPKTIILTYDTVKSTFVTGGGAMAKATALGGTRGKSWNIGGTATVGVGPVVPMTTFSVGGNFNYSRSKSEGALMLIDLDGDGLADKVYKKRGRLFYRKHIADSEYHFHYDTYEHELMDYSDIQNPRGLKDFLSEVSSTTTWGLQLSLGVTYSGSWPTTKSTTSVYFADVNADGLPDLITDDGVLFNVTERDGTVKFRNYYSIAAENAGTENDSTFVQTVTDTCGGIIFSGEVSEDIVCQTDWKLDTTFSFSYPITPENEALYAHRFHYADSMDRTSDHRCVYIYCEDSTLHGDVCYIIIYKRVIVSCDPFPTSTSASEILERDPDLETVKVWVAPRKGTINIISSIRLIEDNSVSRQQSRTCDGVSFAIQHNTDVNAGTNQEHNITLLPGLFSILDTGNIGPSDYTPHTSFKTDSVEKGDLILFRLISGNNHDFDNVVWHQQIWYFGESDVYDSQEDFLLSGNKSFGAGKPDPLGENRMDLSFTVSTATIYPSNSPDVAVLTVEIVDTFGTICTTWKDTLQNNMLSHIWAPLTNYHVPENNHIKIYVTCENSSFPWHLVRITPHLVYYVKNGSQIDTIECYPQVDMRINNHDGSLTDSAYHILFGPLYKGWGQFAYHNNDTLPNGTVTHDKYIYLNKLIASRDNFPNSSSSANNRKNKLQGYDMRNKDTANVRESSEMLEELSADTLYSPLSLKTSWVEIQPDFQHQAWVGYGNINFVTDSTMCNTRMLGYYTNAYTEDIEEYDHPVPVVTQGQVKTVRKQNYTKMKNHSLTLSAPIGPFSSGASLSKGYNKIITDYMDLNGDRYPDVVGQSLVQYSQPWGGIGEVTTMGIFESGITRSETQANGENFGASFEIPSRGASNNPKNSKISYDGAGSASVSHGGGRDETSMTWMDINGDGLPDKVFSNNGLLEVCMNTGYGFLNTDIYNYPCIRKGRSDNFGLSFGGNFNIGQASIGGGIGVNFSGNVTDTMLMDFNADGLPDIVKKDSSGGQKKLKVSYAKGNGGWSDWETISNLTNISFGRSFSESADVSVTVGFTFLSIIKLCVGISGSPYSRSFSKDSVQLTDVNGDGYVDYVTSRNEDSMKVHYNQAAKTNLLRKVTNFTGSSFEMDYDMPLACYDKPQRSWNLARVETRNNVDTCPVGGNRTLTTFAYESPSYNRHERTDYGYRRVITSQHDTEDNDNPYRYTVEEFNNRDFIRRGRKTRECVYDADSLPYVEHLYSDTLYDFAGNVVDDGGCARTDVYVKKEVDITNWYEGGHTPQITSVTQREYDRRRNVVRYIHRGDTTHYGEWFAAEIEYAQGMPYNMVALPVRIEIRDHDDSLLQKRTADYHPNNGRMTSLCLHSNADTARYDFLYDSCGNMERVTMPANSTGQRLVMKYHYDNAVHIYPVLVENFSLGYSSAAEYDFRFGKPVKTTDINGNEMWYEYDNIGRTVRITAPYEQDSHAPYTIKMEYHPHNYQAGGLWNSPNPYSYACTYHYDQQHPNDPIRTTLITDGLGRLLQTKKDAEIGGHEVSLVTGRVMYDCFGRTVAQYHPFTEDTAFYAAYNDSLTADTETLTEYDVMDRQKQVIQPYGYVTTMDYDFDTCMGKKCFRTTVTDAKSNKVRTLSGTFGQQLKQIAPGNTVTLFKYDAIGRLLRSTDPDNISTIYTYDMLGRMIQRIHPDAGIDRYHYDAASNLTSHVNALSDSVIYRYHYNQLTNIEFLRYPTHNVHYQYGTAANANTNAVGKIIFQEDASGWQTFNYGKLGEVTENIRTFALPFESRPYTFKMQYEYDSWNRIRKMTYPDGEVVSYGYDRGGMLNNVTGNKNGVLFKYIDSIFYNKFELKDSVGYGNGTRVRYEYDSLKRLRHLRSYEGHDILMQDITYTYDSVGNITGIVNSAVMLPNGLGGTYSNSYSYDNLYRLKGSTGAWQGSRSLNYQTGTEYYANGRIKRKQVVADVFANGGVSNVCYDNEYCYDNPLQPNTLSRIDPPPQAPINIGTPGGCNSAVRQYFMWDGCGNLVIHDTYTIGTTQQRLLCWDEQNRLLGVKDEGYLSYYQYDAGGERTYKLTGKGVLQNTSGEWQDYYLFENATLYASPYLVATSQGYTKHYYAEAERIASKIGGGGLLDLAHPLAEGNVFDDKEQAISGQAGVVLGECLKAKYYGVQTEFDNLRDMIDSLHPESNCYWYHPDHLGSSSWVTDTGGHAIQHLHYLPWGENFVDQRANSFDGVRYTFSAKEKDSETGLSYFGSRYYSSNLSIWLSVDPMSDKYPSLSSYVYCANNPVKVVDPNGEAWDIDGYKYYPGQNCPDDVSKSTRDKWNTMNEIYKTKNGKSVIEALNGDDCQYHVSSDIKSGNKGGFSFKDKTIYLNGNDRNVGVLAHEMFHAYQDYHNRSEASIFNEVEANLFSFSVLSQQCAAAVNCMMPPENSSLLNGRPSKDSSKEYQQYYGDVIFLLLGNFNREKFNNVVSGFLQYSKDNAGGNYSKGYKKGSDIYEETLIEKIFK